ncbi:hypothetical protein [Algirhabdus cladophorae]|uniref:hypothetical protein n=1 Tax=Algirhabdus cladophorae TaxID=3377108 RepID=UPI003B84A864
MIWNLALGLLAGFAVPLLEGRLKTAMESIALKEMPLRETEMDLLALLLGLMIAAAVAALLGIDSSVFLMALGALAGLFGKKIWAGVKSSTSTD